jgi:hypothetical protein
MNISMQSISLCSSERIWKAGTFQAGTEAEPALQAIIDDHKLFHASARPGMAF